MTENTKSEECKTENPKKTKAGNMNLTETNEDAVSSIQRLTRPLMMSRLISLGSVACNST